MVHLPETKKELRNLFRHETNKSKHLLVESELKTLKTFDSKNFIGKSNFEEDGTQNYLVFKPMYRSFKFIASVGNGCSIDYWKSKGLSDKRINSIPIFS